MQTSIIGIDPGIIHTGCVALQLDDNTRTIDVTYAVINGVNVEAVLHWVEAQPQPYSLFIEDYNPSNYAREDKKMSEALGRLKAAYPPADNPIVRYVDNAGINTLIPVPVQRIFGVAKFPVTTHHNDLVSAGKIALLGMLQDKEGTLRNLISNVVLHELKKHPWTVMQHG